MKSPHEMSDAELFAAVKKILTAEMSDDGRRKSREEALLKESKLRRTDGEISVIFDKAYEEAEIEYALRFHGLSRQKTAEIISNSEIKLPPARNESVIIDTEFSTGQLSELSGIDSDRITVCRVVGNSMIGAGIEDGDTLIAESTDLPIDALNSGIVIARVNGSLFVKRLIIEGESVVLKSENPDYEPYRVRADDDFDVSAVVKFAVKPVK